MQEIPYIYLAKGLEFSWPSQGLDCRFLNDAEGQNHAFEGADT